MTERRYWIDYALGFDTQKDVGGSPRFPVVDGLLVWGDVVAEFDTEEAAIAFCDRRNVR